MEQVLAMVLRIEEENKVYFYLPEEKREIGFEVDESLIAEFRDAMAEDDSYFVNIDLEAKEVV